uniref:Peptidase S1 domain-containing protein n=1 Tax=Ciona intestinalis TaxID=7719 RepID=F6XHV4_CIOIN
CGKTYVSPQFTWNQRIAGGNEEVPGSWPWLRWFKIHYGGSIISEQAILTAGHSVDFLSSPSQLNVVVGRHVRNSNDGEQLIKVKQIVFHNDYHPLFLRNGIAILILSEPITYISTIRPICYSDSNITTSDIDNGIQCIANGRPFTQQDCSKFAFLFFNLVNYKNCDASYGGTISMDTQICAGSTKGGVDTCQGDSGGPLVCLIGESTWFQVGVTSFGKDCGNKRYPGVYTKVSYYYQWIKPVTSLPLQQPT